MLETLNQSECEIAEANHEDAFATEAVSDVASAQSEAVKESSEDQRVAINVLKKLNQNPMMIDAALGILQASLEEPREESTLLESLHHELVERKALPVQPLSAVLELLVREGAAVESVTVDGVPYEGTLHDAFEDESITEDCETLIYVQTTGAGVLLAQRLMPEERARTLFCDRPDLAPALMRTLELCNTSQGLATSALQELLDADGYLCRDERTNIPTRYPSLFANLLKDAGCIRWDHAWITTDLGRSLLVS